MYEKNEMVLNVPELLWRQAPDSYFKRAATWIKYLRQQTSDKNFINLVILSTRLVDFLRFNLTILQNSLHEEFDEQKGLSQYFLYHLTWFLAEVSCSDDKQIQMKLTNNLLKASSDLIAVTNFS